MRSPLQQSNLASSDLGARSEAYWRWPVPYHSIAVSATTSSPATAAATSQLTALFLVAAVGFLGPIVARVAAGLLAPALASLSPVGGFLASANLRTATRRFSSATTPLVLTVALSCTLLFSTTTQDHATSAQQARRRVERTRRDRQWTRVAHVRIVRYSRHCRGGLGSRSDPHAPLARVLGSQTTPSPAEILSGGPGGGLDVGVIAGSLTGLHGNTIALGRQQRRWRGRPCR